ncbi:MAG: twin-arginine translocase TatA/TatE family subunit [Chthonomonas sp.]|nr:twin-arginine translocase TatA/TatE family subunit [Chthonomonas sp.]
MFGGVPEWLILLMVVLLLFGGKQIPQMMRGIGKGLGELQKGVEDSKRMLNEAAMEANEPAPAKPTPAVLPTPEASTEAKSEPSP